MTLTTPVDIYCERMSIAFWAEPLNAASNAAFIIAALIAANTARRYDTAPVTWLLIALAAMIGIGSFLFHTFANVWSSLADVIPIWTFVAIYVLTAFTLIGETKHGKVIAIAVAVVAVLTVIFLAIDSPDAAPTAPDPLNGSGQYAPAVVALLVFTTLAFLKAHPIRWWFLAATVTFAVSLSLRTVDMAWCETMPSGTHYWWHILNGALIGILLQALIRHSRPVAA